MIDEIETPAPTDTHRFFTVATDDLYEQVRTGLDDVFGHPKADTWTCLPPAAEAPHDAQGRPLVAVENAQMAWPEVGLNVETLIGLGYVVEIDRSAWEAAHPEGEE
jgi:hypothetical protein